MMWAAFSSSEVVELIRCDTSIDDKEYIIIVEKGLLPTIDKLFSSINGGAFHFSTR